MKKQNTKPFFARLLETQELEQVSGGRTLKAPSDTDELDATSLPADGGSTTLKYPSDSDEGTGA